MLSPKTQTNLKNAKVYFEEHLAVGDYYSDSERVVGEWIGTGAAVLELGGLVGKDEFSEPLRKSTSENRGNDSRNGSSIHVVM